MEEGKSKANYKDSFKATILFSGVQVYQIFIRIVRSKFVAMLLGPAGMGITSLLRSTTDLISSATNLGLKTSGVKSIASARVAKNTEQLQATVSVLRRLVLFTGIIGMVICAVLSPLWSKQSFGNSDYIWSFVLISLVILLDQVNQGEIAVLQGLQLRKLLARANIIGQTLSLILTIPLYYFWGVKAIVSVLVFSSLLSLLITSFYVRRANIKRVKVTLSDIIDLGKEIIKLGFLLSVQNLLLQGSVYIVRNYVSQTGGLDQVGLYSAGTTIITMYLGLVFTAMATDYFPRLASTANVEEMCDAMRSQAEIALLLFAPIIIAFVVFIKPIILILFSDKFLAIDGMLYWAMAGTLIKAMAWSMSYSILAKSSAKLFFFNELFAIIITFLCNMLGYKYFGLTGFGISILVSYTIYLLQMFFLTKYLYNFSFGKTMWLLFAFLNLLVIVSLVVKTQLSGWLSYFLGGVLIMGSVWFSLKMLDKKMNLKQIYQKRIRKQ